VTSHTGAKSRVRIKDIADHLGISPRSVSQALSDTESTTKVSAEKRKKILQTARRMGYRPDRMAKALRTGRTGLVGVLVFGFQNPFVIQRLEAVMNAVKEAGYLPFTQLARRSREAVEGALHAMLEARVEGIVVVQPPAALEAEFFRQSEAAKTPMVALGGSCLDRVPSFVPDRRKDFRSLVMHVASQGACSLRLIVGERVRGNFSKNVLAHENGFTLGFRDGLLEARRAGFPVTGAVTRIDKLDRAAERGGEVHWLHTPGYRVMRQLLEEGKLPDAILFQGDVWAQGALRACAEHGLRIPEDLMVAGYDNDPGSSAGFIPLTTVAQSHQELGRLAVDNLLQRISGGEVANALAKTVPGMLIARRSSLRVPPSPLDL
jgi:LacI family transcriptional regulator